MRVADGGREALWGGRGNSLIKLAVYVYSPLGSNNPFVRSTFSLLVIMPRKWQERSTPSTAAQPAEYFYGNSAAQPAVDARLRRLAFNNLGWHRTSKRHTIQRLAQEVQDIVRRKEIDAIGLAT